MVHVVSNARVQETLQAKDLRELSQKISFAAIELGKVAEVVGNRLAGFDDLIRDSRINCLGEINKIHDAWYRADVVDRKKCQEDLRDVLTEATSITATTIFNELSRIITDLGEVATRADIGNVFDRAKADIRELSLECLTFIGSLHSTTLVSQEIISFDRQRSEYSEATKTHKSLHDKLFDLSVSFHRCIHELAGNIVVFALQEAGREPKASMSVGSTGNACSRAQQIVRDKTVEISAIKFAETEKPTTAGRDSMRTALGLLDYVIDSISIATSDSRPTSYDFSGLTRTISQIQTALALTSGVAERLLTEMQSTNKSTVEHSLEQIQFLGAALDQLLGSNADSTQELPSNETLRLLTMQTELCEHLQAAIRQENRPQNYLLALSRFGLSGLDRIKEILLSEKSSMALRDACLGSLTDTLRQQSSPSALPESYNRWFGELLTTLQSVPRDSETTAALSELHDLYKAVKLTPE